MTTQQTNYLNNFPNPAGAPTRFSHGLRLLFRTMRPRYSELLLAEPGRTTEGFEFDVYQPSRRPLRTILMIYGMAIGGKDDPRAIKFARASANAGLRVVVPHLPGLMGFRIEPDDLRRLEGIASHLAQTSPQRLGLIGFSTGGSYSLLLAANERLAEKIGPIVLFSPIYDAGEVFDHIHNPPHPPYTNEREEDIYIWGRFVIAYRNRATLGLVPVVAEALEVLLGDYEKYDLDVKRAFYQNHVQLHNLTGREDLVSEGEALAQLSARGQLAQVRSPVYILHDAADRVVLPDQSRRMYAELAEREGRHHEELLVTPWLSHVVMKTTGSPSELYKIISFLGELF